MKKLTALIILDGFGCREQKEHNAIRADGAANINRYISAYPHTNLEASGIAVGLPKGQMGNSEVGHLNMGAGRVVYQELTRITKAIDDGDFFENPAFIKAIDSAKAKGKKLHLFGLCSDGGVHSHTKHIFALVEMAKNRGLKDVFLHCFMDGRDVPPQSGVEYIQKIEAELKNIGCGKIATVSGRYYAMDRDNRFERLEKAYAALTYGEGVTAQSAKEAVEHSYALGVTDEFIEPAVIIENGTPVAKVEENDSVIFFNFRPDRARELTRAYLFEDFDGFARKSGCFPLTYVAMTQYDKAFEDKLYVAFKPQSLKNTLGEYIAKKGLKQLRIAETEKYAHVTFFFNGGVEAPNQNEDRVLIPSPKVATYDLQPEMSAYEIADEAVKRINSGEYDLMILNFANPDMVGHTGVMTAATKAVHAVDECTKKVVDAVLSLGGRCILTADHGNCELMADDEDKPFTAHTTNPVPFVLIDNAKKSASLRCDGRLCDIAPTLLDVMGIEQPEEMTGRSLLMK